MATVLRVFWVFFRSCIPACLKSVTVAANYTVENVQRCACLGYKLAMSNFGDYALHTDVAITIKGNGLLIVTRREPINTSLNQIVEFDWIYFSVLDV